jgi:hypothetical protein
VAVKERALLGEDQSGAIALGRELRCGEGDRDADPVQEHVVRVDDASAQDDVAGEDGAAWCDAARELAAETGLPLDALRIGHSEGDLFDPRLLWTRHRGIQRDGAILVRPDRYVAWRQVTAADGPRAALADALGLVLARPVEAPTTATAGVL